MMREQTLVAIHLTVMQAAKAAGFRGAKLSGLLSGKGGAAARMGAVYREDIQHEHEAAHLTDCRIVAAQRREHEFAALCLRPRPVSGMMEGTEAAVWVIARNFLCWG
jgi:hypothetical protein